MKVLKFILHPICVTAIAIVVGLFAFAGGDITCDGADFGPLCGVVLGLPLALAFSAAYTFVWYIVRALRNSDKNNKGE